MTMPVEPGIVDTNILIYALDTVAPQHAAPRALLDAGREDRIYAHYRMRYEERRRREGALAP
jgi:hypothetical protein